MISHHFRICTPPKNRQRKLFMSHLKVAIRKLVTEFQTFEIRLTVHNVKICRWRNVNQSVAKRGLSKNT